MNTASKGCLDVDNKGELDTEAELHHTIPTEPDPNQNPLRTVVTVSLFLGALKNQDVR